MNFKGLLEVPSYLTSFPPTGLGHRTLREMDAKSQICIVSDAAVVMMGTEWSDQPLCPEFISVPAANSSKQGSCGVPETMGPDYLLHKPFAVHIAYKVQTLYLHPTPHTQHTHTHCMMYTTCYTHHTPTV